MVAKVVPAVRLPNGVSDVYDYLIPETFAQSVIPGAVVIIPFAGRAVAGLVIDVLNKSDYPRPLKNVLGLADGLSPLPSYIPELWKKSSEIFATTFSRFVWLALPSVPKRMITTKTAVNTKKQTLNIQAKNETASFFWINNENDRLNYIKSIINENTNHQILILVPTIREVEEITRLLPNTFAYHSGLSDGAKYKTAVSSVAGEKLIVVGTRNAVFLPFSDLGAILIVSSGSESHKNEDSDPRHDARIMASLISRATGAKLYAMDSLPPLGQTPVGSMGRWHYINNPTSHPYHSLDLNEIGKRERAKIYISDELLVEIDNEISKNGRILIYLNKRGLASFYSCKDCRTLVTCPNCAVSLTVFGDYLSCANCKNKFNLPPSCVNCQGTNLYTIGIGSKKIYDLLKRKYPDIKIAHLDREDNAPGLNEMQIIVGTGAIFSALSFEVKKFSFIADVFFGAGAVNSGFDTIEKTARTSRVLASYLEDSGRLAIQCIDPNAVALLAISDPLAYINLEILERKEFGFPPFKTEILIYGAGDDDKKLWEQAVKLKLTLKNEFVEADVQEPHWSEPKVFRGKNRLTMSLRVPPFLNRANLVKYLPKGFTAEAKIL